MSFIWSFVGLLWSSPKWEFHYFRCWSIFVFSFFFVCHVGNNCRQLIDIWLCGSINKVPHCNLGRFLDFGRNRLDRGERADRKILQPLNGYQLLHTGQSMPHTYRYETLSYGWHTCSTTLGVPGKKFAPIRFPSLSLSLGIKTGRSIKNPFIRPHIYFLVGKIFSPKSTGYVLWPSSLMNLQSIPKWPLPLLMLIEF